MRKERGGIRSPRRTTRRLWLIQSAQNKLRVLFVDDEAPIRDVMRIELPRMGHEVCICENGQTALAAIEKNTFDAAIIDLRMPGISGWDVVSHLQTVSPETEIIISTGHGNIEDAIQALRRGVYDFLTKPTKLALINSVLQRVADKRNLKNKALALETRLKAVEGSPEIVGDTPAMQRVKRLIERIAPTDSNVLILGETGTGKELVARRIHELSRRAQMPFVAVNCGALPENLVESELFGHRKGAFTGADATRKGLIEVANGGTLFLDELGELDKGMQVKLLRVLESGEVRRVGENESFHVNIRVICATNRNLKDMVAEGSFREDLFFRVNTFEVPLPALRERREDIPDLARTLIARHLRRSQLPDGFLPEAVVAVLKQHDWNGNVRELANALEHAVIMSDGHALQVEDLPTSITQKPRKLRIAGEPGEVERPKTLREIEMEVILETLERNSGDKPRTANELGIALKTLYNKLNQHQIQNDVG
ncbi:MAG: sigma-54-dependent Fis family transcriptional regulator [Planctomycetes bacterium]|nr:sigma-54-dependent Fis family transcriptional regulator [Planctomycetota bacterium]